MKTNARSRIVMSMAAGSVLLAATVRSQTPPAFDLVIAGGRIVDGTGAPWFRGDVGIKGDHIAAVGDLSQAAAARRIDARDHMVAPGFVDMLGQSEMTLLADNRAESKIRQGITSEITGEGGSAAPVTEATLKDQRAWLDKYKIKVDWTDFRGYFDALRRARPAINLGSFVGAAQVRQVVLGSEDAQPTPEQLHRMEALVETAMQQGALGLSTSLIYPPGSYARTPELVALARVAARHGGVYASHIRDEASHEMDALEEAITIGREAKIPVEIWHLKVAGRLNWGHMKDVVARIERARAEGLDVTADMYPYVASGNGLDATVPQWAQAGGVDAMIQRFHDPVSRARILKEIREGHGGEWDGWKGRPPEDILIVSVLDPSLTKWTGKRLFPGGDGDGEAAGGGADRPRGGGPRERLRGPLLDERGRPAVRAAPSLGGHRPRRRRLLARRALRREQTPSPRPGDDAAGDRPLRARSQAVLDRGGGAQDDVAARAPHGPLRPRPAAAGDGRGRRRVRPREDPRRGHVRGAERLLRRDRARGGQRPRRP
jgi:hypothetical protein